MEKLIETMSKNKTSELRVSLREYQGYDLIEVRTFVDAYTGGDRVPTKQGVICQVRLLPKLITALQRAAGEARAAGLLEGSNGEDRPQDDAAGVGEGALAPLNAG